jgi:hypothetical protein
MQTRTDYHYGVYSRYVLSIDLHWSDTFQESPTIVFNRALHSADCVGSVIRFVTINGGSSIFYSTHPNAVTFVTIFNLSVPKLY